VYSSPQTSMEVARLQAQWSGEGDHGFAALCVAQRLYRRARASAWLRDAWCILSRRRRCLLDLGEVEKRSSIRGRAYAGTRAVPLARIQGSAGRCRDFDNQFRPRNDHTRERWLGIAIAQQLGIPLPPVKLVQVGGLYFVQDGHHRISVARAMDQREIDAEVIVWETVGPLPWETTLEAELRGYRPGPSDRVQVPKDLAPRKI
jgi:hypothetical protein